MGSGAPTGIAQYPPQGSGPSQKGGTNPSMPQPMPYAPRPMPYNPPPQMGNPQMGNPQKGGAGPSPMVYNPSPDMGAAQNFRPPNMLTPAEYGGAEVPTPPMVDPIEERGLGIDEMSRRFNEKAAAAARAKTYRPRPLPYDPNVMGQLDPQVRRDFFTKMRQDRGGMPQPNRRGQRGAMLKQRLAEGGANPRQVRRIMQMRRKIGQMRRDGQNIPKKLMRRFQQQRRNFTDNPRVPPTSARRIMPSPVKGGAMSPQLLDRIAQMQRPPR